MTPDQPSPASRKIEGCTALDRMILSVVMMPLSTWWAVRAWDRYQFDSILFWLHVTCLLSWFATFVVSAFKVDAALSAEGKREGKQMSDQIRYKPCVYQKYGHQNLSQWQTGRIWGVDGIHFLADVSGLTREEADLFVKALESKQKEETD